MLAGARLEAVEQHGIGRALLALQFQFRIIQDQVAVISNAQFRANLHDNLGACARCRHEFTSLRQFHFSRTIQMDAHPRQKDASHFSTQSLLSFSILRLARTSFSAALASSRTRGPAAARARDSPSRASILFLAAGNSCGAGSCHLTPVAGGDEAGPV